MAELQHHGIVRVVEAELEDGGYYFFVMEFLTGGDLHQAVIAGRLKVEDRILVIVKNIGDALEFAHKKRVIHRDVKPGNVLLDEEGRPRLTDFDLVHAFDTTGGTRTGMLGTFLYAPPEAMSRPQDIGVAADVYSLAMTTIFCLYGAELPVDVLRGADFIETLSCNRAVKDVLRRATDWDAKGRFKSVSRFMAALESSFKSAPQTNERRERITFFQRLRRAVLDAVGRRFSRERHDARLPQEDPTGHSTGPRPLRDFDLDTEPTVPATELAKECPSCGTLYPSDTVFCANCRRRLDTSHVPYVLPGKFRFEKRIGIGGMGVVYRAADLALGRPVAVKTLRRVSPEDAMRLRREARTAAAVSHRHLAPIYGIETWQGTPMLVLELLEGGTLAHRIEKGRMAQLEVVELGIAMADALAQLHASNILHRDIKPSNIGFTRDGVPKLMDFCIALATFDLRRNHFVRTLSYLSPEAINGETPTVDFDLWSLAVVLYECVLGRKVFSGGDPKLLMAHIRLGRVPELDQVLSNADDSLGEFFRSALHKTLSRRPASAVEMRQRLETVRDSLS